MHSVCSYRDSLLPHSLERDHLAPALLRRVGRLGVRLGRGRFHEAADLLRRAPLHLVGDVRIGVEGEPGAEVAQHAGQGLRVHAAGEGHGCKRMPEIVEAHMFLDAGHFQQLAVDPGHRVRAPVAAGAGRWEQDGVVGVLFMLPHQDVHRLLGQRHPADGVLGFRLGHHQFPIDAGDLLAHREDAVLHVQVVPQQRQQLPPPQAAGQLQEEHGQDAVLLCLPEIHPQLLRRDDGHLPVLFARDAAVVAGIVRDDPLLDRLLQRRREHHVDAPDRTAGQGRIGLCFKPLHPPAGLGIVVHLLDLDGSESLEFDHPDGRHDVVLDDIRVGLGGVGADHRLAVGLEPQPAPLCHGVVLVVVHRDAPVVPDGPVQLLLALGPCLGGHTFLDGPAGDGIDPQGVSALPAAVGLSADAALAVCSFLCHCLSLLLQ